MNNGLNSFRIPTILGLAIIIFGTAVGVYLVLQNQTLSSQASVDNTPTHIEISNITDTSAALTWQTASKTPSFILYGLEDPNQTVVDDRDSSTPTSRINHLVTIRDLTPQTTYQYKIIAGKFSSPVSQFQTAPTSLTQNNLKPIIGSVLDNNQPLENGLVFLNIPGATLQVTTIKSLGSFIIPLTDTRELDLSDLISSSSGIANLKVVSEDGREALATIDLSNSEPLSPLKLGQNLDLTKKPEQLGIETNKFDLNQDGQVSTADYAIVNKAINKKPIDKKADLNSDNKVDKKDLDLILSEIKKSLK